MRKSATLFKRMGWLASVLTVVLVLAALAGMDTSAANAKNDYAFDGVHITRESISVKVGGSYRLSLRKINVGEESVSWSSADPAIATVKDSEVFGVKAGETTVTVTYGEFSDTVRVRVTENDPAAEEYEHTAELMRDFLDMRLGMFLHFNSSTYEFANIGGDWAGENRTSTFNPTSWNPSSLDCEQWAKTAKSAGMTFAVLTTKHHDGFNLWDSAYTDYDVGSATLKTDVVKEFVDACRKEGIKPGLYFSMLDIKHKITSSSCTANDIEFIKAQITELMTNYGEIPFIIFDAWNAYWGGPNYSLLPYEEIVNLVHTLQPNCLVINISCEANNVRSQVAMFESAAGQSVPDWFDNLNISCNTPTSHWFWCTKYNTETFKTAEWVLNENINKFRDSDTVFILNASPNQKGVLINKYTELFAKIGESYAKVADVEKLPERYISDYDYHENLLFHKEITTLGVDGNATADRAVDGYCDYEFSHETASKTTNGMAYWIGDIGYMAKLGKLRVHVSSDMSADAIGKTYVFVLEENPGRTTYRHLNASGNYIAKYKLADGSRIENCYTLDLEGIEGRCIVLVQEATGVLSFSEVAVNPYGEGQENAYSLREKFGTVSYTIGSELTLPADGLFVTASGGLKKEAIAWQTDSLDLTKIGKVTVTGISESGCQVTCPVQILSAGIYTEVPSVGVTASSMWDASSEWANVANIIDKSGLTLNPSNLLYSTHDNAYNAVSMWHSATGQTTGWLIFDLGRVTKVSNALIWNHNQYDKESLSNRGIKNMTVYYTDKANPSESDWIAAGSYTLTQATCSEAQRATDFISLGSISARKIKFVIHSNYGHREFVGVAEVIFLSDQSESGLDTAALNTALSSFEMLSRFDYPEATYNAAKLAYETALSGRGTAKSQDEIDALASALNGKLTELKQAYSPKTMEPLSALHFTVKAGESIPTAVTVTFTDQSQQTAEVIWEAVPEHKMTTPGSFGISGVLAGTPYTVSASVVVTGLSDASLKTLVTTYRQIETSAYTAESAAAFTAALDDAVKVLDRSDKTQEELDSAKSALVAARYALVRDYSEKDGITLPDTTDTPSTENTPDTTVPPDTTNTPTTTDTPTTGDVGGGKNNRSLGPVIGIAVGILAILVAGAVLFLLMKKKKQT